MKDPDGCLGIGALFTAIAIFAGILTTVGWMLLGVIPQVGDYSQDACQWHCETAYGPDRIVWSDFVVKPERNGRECVCGLAPEVPHDDSLHR